MTDMVTDALETQEFILNLGPQHPSTHGVYRARLVLNGETIVSCENIIGYLHRGMEKIAETRTWSQFAPYTSRVDYVSGALQNWGYALVQEKLGGITVPQRAEYIRVIIGELQRIASHLVMLGSMVIDFNAITAWSYAFNAREGILDLLEMASGSRLTLNYIVAGGVAADLPEGFAELTGKQLIQLKSRLDDFDRMISGNEIFVGRTKGVAPVSADQAIDWGLTGPNLRASGVAMDLRKSAPYGAYPAFEFEVPVATGGDCRDRYTLRVHEIRQSVRIVEQALAALPGGEFAAKVPRTWKPAAGEAYAEVEAARGILGFYAASDGGRTPYRLHMRSPSFVNIGIIPGLAVGLTIQDFVSLLASLDFVLGDIDR